MFLSRLYQTLSSGVMTSLEGFNMAALMRVLKDALDSTTEEYEKDGIVIGYSLALSSAAIFSTDKTHQEEIKASRKVLFDKVSAYGKDELAGLEAQCFCFAMTSLTISLDCSGLVEVGEVMKTHKVLNAHVKSTPQVRNLLSPLNLTSGLRLYVENILT